MEGLDSGIEKTIFINESERGRSRNSQISSTSSQSHMDLGSRIARLPRENGSFLSSSQPVVQYTSPYSLEGRVKVPMDLILNKSEEPAEVWALKWCTLDVPFESWYKEQLQQDRSVPMGAYLDPYIVLIGNVLCLCKGVNIKESISKFHHLVFKEKICDFFCYQGGGGLMTLSEFRYLIQDDLNYFKALVRKQINDLLIDETKDTGVTLLNLLSQLDPSELDIDLFNLIINLREKYIPTNPITLKGIDSIIDELLVRKWSEQDESLKILITKDPCFIKWQEIQAFTVKEWICGIQFNKNLCIDRINLKDENLLLLVSSILEEEEGIDYVCLQGGPVINKLQLEQLSLIRERFI